MSQSEVIQFKNPTKLNAGFRALETIPTELMRRGSYRPLLLLDSTSRSVEKQIIKGFQGSQMALLIQHMDRQQPNSTAIADLISSYQANGCDAIIVSGSPALLDFTRFLNVAVSQDKRTTPGRSGITGHLQPWVAVVFGFGQALHLTESFTMEGCRFETIEVMPSLLIIDDRLTAGITWQSALSGALAALTLAFETLAFGRHDYFAQVYAHSALKEIVRHLPSVLRKPKNHASKTSLLAAELHAGLSAGKRNDHPSWITASQIAPQSPLSKGIVAALVLSSTLAQAKKKSLDRTDLLLTTLGGSEYYSAVYAQKLDPWDKVIDCIETFLEHLRVLRPGYLPHHLDESGLSEE